VNNGGGKKAPGRNGLGFEFFKTTWEVLRGDMLELFTQMFFYRKLSEQQNRGVIACIPKTARPTHPNDVRPITLLNTDYKILGRIIAKRILPALVELLLPSQYCGVPGNTILESVATLMDAVDYALVA